MKMSRRAKRMERHHARHKQPGLNMVSLMDIFTILVFFLLVSSSTVHQLPSRKDIRLPTSVAQRVPQETLVITVAPGQILIDGRKVVEISEVLADDSTLIPALEQELHFQATKSRIASFADASAQGRAVTIMGDEDISYALLRKILNTCREANYTRVAFAALQASRVGRDAS